MVYVFDFSKITIADMRSISASSDDDTTAFYNAIDRCIEGGLWNRSIVELNDITSQFVLDFAIWVDEVIKVAGSDSVQDFLTSLEMLSGSNPDVS